MAAIYGNNLHEKLVGVAISKEHLKYNTPFCDLVDDPEWAADINLALDYNSATTGNLDAADRAVQNLTLYSSTFDGSTVDFYVHKMSMNPAFKPAIDNMLDRWANPTGWDDDFQFDLNEAIKDCLNSPCNLFNETSDSIGRMAQSASTNTSGNTFGVDELSDSFTNMIDGLDQAIFNKIPAIFQDAFVEVTQVANKAFTNTQAVLAGKKNLTAFNNKVTNSKSFRSTGDMFRYTPDVKSSYDYSAASSNVLSKIKEDIGGCFNRFEFKYRYNPYENNMSRPLGDKTLQVNGRDYDTSPDGKPDRSPDNTSRISKQTQPDSIIIQPSGPNIITSGDGPNTIGKSYMDDKIKISSIYTLKPRGSAGAHSHYSVFAALADEENKTLWFEGYAATPNDILTLQGTSNIGANHRLGISYQGDNADFIKRALNSKGEDVSATELARYGSNTQPGAYAAGFKHDLTDAGMETLWNTPNTLTLNDGVAVSRGLFRAFMNDPSLSHGNSSYVKPQRANEFFIAARPAGSGAWRLYKVCDSNGQKNINVDFTMGAFKHFLKTFEIGDGDLQAASKGRARKQEIKGTEWVKVLKEFQQNIGPMEIKVCQGNKDDIKEQLGIGDLTLPGVEAQSLSGTDLLGDDPFSPASIDAGSLDGTPTTTTEANSTTTTSADGRVDTTVTEASSNVVTNPGTVTKVTLPDGTVETRTLLSVTTTEVGRSTETVTRADNPNRPTPPLGYTGGPVNPTLPPHVRVRYRTASNGKVIRIYGGEDQRSTTAGD